MKTTNDNSSDFFGNPVSIYTGQQAIEDGLLVEVTETAREAGFNWPVALTAEVWADIQAIPASQSHQDVSGRLWDVLSMLFFAIRRHKDAQRIDYSIIMHVGRKTNYFLTAEITLWNTDGAPMMVIKKRTV
ncbi:hypothetical protein KC887_00630 [Candidatus Kaiserbacteria bacterium]|nr:hypothetical protein [Candidatus Kaiserbacteria bacterium]